MELSEHVTTITPLLRKTTPILLTLLSVVSLLGLAHLFFANPSYAYVPKFETVGLKKNVSSPQLVSGETSKVSGSMEPKYIMHIFGDMHENFTADFMKLTLPKAMSKYPDMQFRFYYVSSGNTKNSQNEELVLECLAQQNAYASNYLQVIENEGNADQLLNLKNIDKERISTCISDPRTLTVVKLSNDNARTMGILYTPTMILEKVGAPADEEEVEIHSFVPIETIDEAVNMLGREADSQNIKTIKASESKTMSPAHSFLINILTLLLEALKK